MSDIFGAVGDAIGAFGPLVGDSVGDYALIVGGPWHELGNLIPDIVTEEIHHDEMTITQHPVETGAPITDHAFMAPFDVQMHAFWSDSTAQSEGYVQAVYQQLLALQASAQPFNVITNKRVYSNMLLRSLMVKTDPTSWSALDVVATCQEIIIVTSSQGGANTGDADPTDGSNSVGSTDPATGAPYPTNPDQSYSMPAAGEAPADAGGSYNMDTSPYSGGQIVPQAAPEGAPTVESLTANQGV